MLEWLFLLLPIAAGYGWYMGSRSTQQNKQRQNDRVSRDYVDGVNFLLANQKDKALALFLDLLKEENASIEVHLTLGNLFRSRGEVDKAIHIHQALTESANLTFEQRLLATQQLGRDYMAAGLYDRAELIFLQLVDEQDFRASALQQLSSLYQATSEWYKAINVAEKLVKLGDQEQKKNIAHYYCELALQSLTHQATDKAITLLKKAHQSDPHCSRVAMMQGRIFIQNQQDQQAIEVLQSILVHDKSLVIETLPLLKACYLRLQQAPAWQDYLQQCVAAQVGAAAQLQLADLLEQQQGVQAVEAFLTEQLNSHPTMRLFCRLIDVHIAYAEVGSAKESLILLKNLVEQQISSKPHYCCQKCGFTSNTLYWHCPSCRQWDSIRPIYGLDGQ